MPSLDAALWFFAAALNALTAFLAYQGRIEARFAAKEAKVAADAAQIISVLVVEAASNIKKIEIATNSMKDALVASTAKASRAEGVEAGRLEEREKS